MTPNWIIYALIGVCFLLILIVLRIRRVAIHAGAEDEMPRLLDAVDHHRKRAQEQPLQVAPELAKALYELSFCHADLGDRTAAYAVITEACQVLLPAARQHPEGLADWLSHLADTYAERAKAAEQTPDAELLDEMRALCKAGRASG